MAGEKRATPRVREHVDRLRASGFETAKFFDALCAIRDDSALPKAHRDAIYKLIAMESFVWYLEALRNEPIDRDKLLAQAKELAEQPAIVKRSAGDQAAALAKADVGKGKGPSAGARPQAGAPTKAAAPGTKPSATSGAPAPPAKAAAGAPPAKATAGAPPAKATAAPPAGAKPASPAGSAPPASPRPAGGPASPAGAPKPPPKR